MQGDISLFLKLLPSNKTARVDVKIPISGKIPAETWDLT
jgi:hypothetical protein